MASCRKLIRLFGVVDGCGAFRIVAVQPSSMALGGYYWSTNRLCRVLDFCGTNSRENYAPPNFVDKRCSLGRDNFIADRGNKHCHWSIHGLESVSQPKFSLAGRGANSIRSIDGILTPYGWAVLFQTTAFFIVGGVVISLILRAYIGPGLAAKHPDTITAKSCLPCPTPKSLPTKTL